MKLASAALSSLVLVTLAGCSKPDPAEQKKKEEAFAAAIASSLSAAVEPTATPKAAGGVQAITGTCTDKVAGYCTEYLGLFPTMAEDFCKKGGAGVVTKGPTPCSREGIVGNCESKGPDASENHYSYKGDDQTYAQAIEAAKIQCSLLSGTFTAEPEKKAAPGTAKKAAPAPKAKK